MVRFGICAVLMVLGACSRPPVPPDIVDWSAIADGMEIRLVVSPDLRRVSVYRGYDLIEEFVGVSFGSSGVGIKRYEGDEITPIGAFKVSDIRTSTRFQIFIELNYPTRFYAERGLGAGIISREEFTNIAEAHRNGVAPLQTTALGGHIGLHGLPEDAPEINGFIDWTNGCIALDNQSIYSLRQLVSVGTPVEVQRPAR